MAHDLTVLDSVNAIVGESPLWDERTGRLYTIDIRGKFIRVVDWASGDISQIDLPQQVGCIALTEDGGLLAAMADGIYRVAEDGSVERVSKPCPILGRRFNDGKAGPDGRFYVGTTDVNHKGAFYRMDHDGTMTLLFDHVGISNGLAWSADGKTLYYCDSPKMAIEAFDFHGEDGTLSNRRTVFPFPLEAGEFDGMTIDADGNLWVAVWKGHCVLKIDPVAGNVLERIDTPVARTACCLFAGEQLDRLVITTAAFEADMAQEPLSGHTFVAEVGSAGVPGDRVRVLS